MYRLIDTHAHLEEIESPETVIAEAKSVGVMAIVVVGSDYLSNQKTLQLAENYRGFVLPALGYHPWDIKDAEIYVNLEFIKQNIDKAIAVGEVGLDYHKKVRIGAEKELQKRVLKEVLKIASAHSKPALLHSRYAWQDTLDSVKEVKLEKAVFHWYTGTSSVLRDIVGQGYYLSATPAVEYHEEHRRAIKESPLDRLLLETDSPVVYGRGSGMEYQARPSDVIRSLRGAALLKGVSEAELAEITTANALRLFSL